MDNEKYGIELQLLTSKLKQQIESTKGILSNFKNKVKDNTTIKFDAKTEQLKWKILDLKEELKSIDTSKYVGMRDFLDTSVKIQKLEEELNDVGNETNEVANNMNKMGVSIRNALDKSTSKMKKFALSLFSIRSIWSLVSRASSNYLAQDQQLSNQLTRTWSSLGAIMTPIIEKLVQGFRILISYVNYFVKALTGKDFIAKATKKINTYNKSLNKTSKSAKSLNKELTSLDEVTNLSFDDSNTTGIEDATAGLDDFSDIKLNKSVTDFLDILAKKLNEAKKLLQPFIDWAINHPDSILKILGGAVMLKTLSKLTGDGGLSTLASLLTPLAKIGIVVAGVNLIYNAVTGRDLIEDLKEITTGLKELSKNTKNNKNQSSNLVKQTKELNNNYEKLAKSSTSTSNSMKDTNKVIIDNIKLSKNWAESTEKNNGITKYSISILRDRIKEEKLLADALEIGYENNKLDEKSRKDAISTLKENIKYYDGLAEKYKKNTQLSSEFRQHSKDLKSSLDAITAKDYACKLTIDNETGKYKVKTFKDTLNELVNKKFNITISALFNGKTAKSKLSEFFTGVNKFANSIKNAFGGVFKASTTSISSLINKFLPSFDVGTNYVPNDMVAQIHKGEMIVPAKYNPMTSGIGGNEETNALLVELNRNILELAKRPNVLNVNGKQFAEATYNDFQNEGNRLNQSMTIKRS